MSGKVSDATAFGYALCDGLKGNVPSGFRDFARHCVGLYRQERTKLIETEVLSLYDVNTYADYKTLKGTERDFYDAISEKIAEFDDYLKLMICGFEDDGTPHIFVIYGAGNLQFCDTQGYGVIGSGEYAAQISLDRHPYSKWERLGNCIFAILSAKFSAEAADGVGPDSVLFVLKPNAGNLQAVLKPRALDEYKQKWKDLPKVPLGVVESLEKNLKLHEQTTHNREADPDVTPSGSETSEDQR